MTQTTATLWVDRYTSHCGACNQLAYPDDTHHVRIAPEPVGPIQDEDSDDPIGCGAKFIKIASRRMEYTPDHLLAIRPDLPIGWTHPTHGERRDTAAAHEEG